MFASVASFLQRKYSNLRPWFVWLNYVVRNRRISRDQWAGEDNAASISHYENLLRWSWDETRVHSPEYFRRLETSVAQAHGRVLELGCGIGTMTRWIAAKPDVASVVAVDAFAKATQRLQAEQLPKVEAICAPADGLKLDSLQPFDCVFLCEFIEHLYPDEELALLATVRKHLAPGARFVVSVPVGWLDDPSHVRAFSRRKFERHLRRHYGCIEGVDRSAGYSQVAWGSFRQ